MTVRVSPIAADSFADTRARSRLGMAMAAMMPMIATTIRSSIRVKPFWLLKTFLLWHRREWFRGRCGSLYERAGYRGLLSCASLPHIRHARGAQDGHASRISDRHARIAAPP